MEGTSVEQFADSNSDHDHTYYGNGCPNEWSGPGPTYGGSDKSCSTRIVQTSDLENQENGVYYSFQAATSGSGGSSIETDNTNVSDTFCPLGWQLPYSGTGGDYYNKSKSWEFLVDSYSLTADPSSSASKFKHYPISTISAGLYQWPNGRLFFQGIQAYEWSITVASSTNAYRVSAGGLLVLNNPIVKPSGHAIRCAHRFSILS